MRTCEKCGLEQEIANFPPRGRGRSKWCRECLHPLQDARRKLDASRKSADGCGDVPRTEYLLMEVATLLKSPVCYRCGARGASNVDGRFTCEVCR